MPATGDAFVTPPGCTGSMVPCHSIILSFSWTTLCRDIFLALQNIGCEPDLKFTCALYPLTACCFSPNTLLMPSSGFMSLPSGPIFCRIAQLKYVVAYT